MRGERGKISRASTSATAGNAAVSWWPHWPPADATRQRPRLAVFSSQSPLSMRRTCALTRALSVTTQVACPAMWRKRSPRSASHTFQREILAALRRQQFQQRPVARTLATSALRAFSFARIIFHRCRTRLRMVVYPRSAAAPGASQFDELPGSIRRLKPPRFEQQNPSVTTLTGAMITPTLTARVNCSSILSSRNGERQ
jgi:hypothetical protein